MTRLILVRHGRTEWNRVERFRGRIDLALDEVGVKQAEATAERLKEWHIAATYSSPLKRAMKTAETLAAPLNMQVQPLDGIIDMSFGKWEGLSPQEVKQRYGELYRLWMEAPHLVKCPGGESLDEVRARAMAALDTLEQGHGRETIVLVTHRVVCKVMVCALLGLDNSHFWQIEQDVCAINVFDFRDNTPFTLKINDTCHLRGLGQ